MLAGAFVASACGSDSTPVDAAVRDTSVIVDARVDTGVDVAHADTGLPVDVGPDSPLDAGFETGVDAAGDNVAVNDTAVDSGAPDTAIADAGALDVVVTDASSSDVVSTDALGSACTDNSTCTAREYCAASGCGVPGTCLNRPVACAANVAPVCGCDSVTYLNLCHAHVAGVRVASTGVCDGGTFDAGGVDATSADASDTCMSNADCAATDFCMIPSGNACGTPGTCAPRPTICPGFCILECGCTGTNYCNACLANRAGTNIAHGGSCADGGI